MPRKPLEVVEDEKDEQGTPEDEAPVEEPQTNGVLVVRQFTEQGQPVVGITPLGDVKVTEIPVILKLGLKEFDSAFGL